MTYRTGQASVSSFMALLLMLLCPMEKPATLQLQAFPLCVALQILFLGNSGYQPSSSHQRTSGQCSEMFIYEMKYEPKPSVLEASYPMGFI